jgi:hypothetical protein
MKAGSIYLRGPKYPRYAVVNVLPVPGAAFHRWECAGNHLLLRNMDLGGFSIT